MVGMFALSGFGFSGPSTIVTITSAILSSSPLYIGTLSLGFSPFSQLPLELPRSSKQIWSSYMTI
jgi:hypothetical protein